MHIIRRLATRATRVLSTKPTLLTQRTRFPFSSQVTADTDADFQPKSKVGATSAPTTHEIEFDSDMNVDALHSKLAGVVREHKVVLFMKGSPRAPMCGYSRLLAETLKYYQIGEFGYVNVLSSDQLRTEVKKFSDWPTFPQLYVDGELIGGSDIVMELHKDGALGDILKSNN